MNQVAIEKDCGISQDVADYMMKQETSYAKNAMSLLQMQCNHYDPVGYTLLKRAVEDCIKDMSK